MSDTYKDIKASCLTVLSTMNLLLHTTPFQNLYSRKYVFLKLPKPFLLNK